MLQPEFWRRVSLTSTERPGLRWTGKALPDRKCSLEANAGRPKRRRRGRVGKPFWSFKALIRTTDSWKHSTEGPERRWHFLLKPDVTPLPKHVTLSSVGPLAELYHFINPAPFHQIVHGYSAERVSSKRVMPDSMSMLPAHYYLMNCQCAKFYSLKQLGKVQSSRDDSVGIVHTMQAQGLEFGFPVPI